MTMEDLEIKALIARKLTNKVKYINVQMEVPEENQLEAKNIFYTVFISIFIFLVQGFNY